MGYGKSISRLRGDHHSTTAGGRYGKTYMTAKSGRGRRSASRRPRVDVAAATGCQRMAAALASSSGSKPSPMQRQRAHGHPGYQLHPICAPFRRRAPLERHWQPPRAPDQPCPSTATARRAGGLAAASEAGATAWRPRKTQENCFQSSVSRNQGLIRLALSRISSKSVTSASNLCFVPELSKM